MSERAKCQALLSAFADVLAHVHERGDGGSWTGEAIAAAKRLADALTAAQASAPRPAGAKRGRKPVHDQAWAEGCLLDMVLRDPDGLPDRQIEMVERLGAQFEIARKLVPGETWLKKIVSIFYRRSRIRDEKSRADYAASVELQHLFDDEDDFLHDRRLRENLADKWCRSKTLQESHKNPSAYVASVMGAADDSGEPAVSKVNFSAELATIRGLTKARDHVLDGTTSNHDGN